MAQAESFDYFQSAIASALINAGASSYEGHQQRKADKQLLQAQNTYNSPANQMSRLQEAGLNPMLVYSGGNVTGNQSQLGTQNYAGSTGVSKGLETFMAVRNAGLDAQLKDQDILSKKVNNSYLEQQIEAQLHRMESEDKIMQAQARMNEAQARMYEHDARVTEMNPNTLSKNAGFSSILGIPLGQYIDRLSARPYFDTEGKLLWK